MHCFRNKGSTVINKQENYRAFLESLEESDHSYFKVVSPPNTSLKQPVPTRWNSVAVMIKSIILNEAIINDMLHDLNKDELVLSHGEIIALKNLEQFLTPFKKISEQLQGEKYPTLSLVWPSVCRLMRLCKPDYDTDGILPSTQIDLTDDADDFVPEVINDEDEYQSTDYGLSELKKIYMNL